MTRSVKIHRGQTLADMYPSDPVEAVIHVLQQAGSPLGAVAIKKALEAGGVPMPIPEKEWRRVREAVRSHENVIVEARTYRWTSQPRPVGISSTVAAREASPLEAFELIVKGRLRPAKKQNLAAVVRAALHGQRPALAVETTPADDPEEAARQRQREIDAIRLVADLAAEVEELTVNEAEADVMIHRVRSRVKRSGLEPIDRAGEATAFDRKRHKPIGGSVSDGATVVVVRPGYVWRAPTEDVLIGKAVVVE